MDGRTKLLNCGSLDVRSKGAREGEGPGKGKQKETPLGAHDDSNDRAAFGPRASIQRTLRRAFRPIG